MRGLVRMHSMLCCACCAVPRCAALPHHAVDQLLERRQLPLVNQVELLVGRLESTLVGRLEITVGSEGTLLHMVNARLSRTSPAGQ